MADYLATLINWTDIGTVFTGFGTLVPSIVTMVTSFVPLIIYMAVIMFLLRFFNAIVHLIESMVTIFHL